MLKYIKKNIILMILGAGAIVSAHTQFWNHQYQDNNPDPDLQRTLVIIDNPHYYDLNPHTASYTSEAQILSGLYEGLFSYHPVTLEPLNAICSSYKVSRDKKRWTFTLKDNVTFSNGDAITASTFRDAWLKLLSNPDAQFASLFDCVQNAALYRDGKVTADQVGITVKGDTTLMITLNTPTEHLTKLLCHHAFSAVSDKPNVYSGAFCVENYDGSTLILKKNDKYRDQENVYLPGITVIQSDDYDENTALYNMGKADWITGGATLGKVLNEDSIHIYAEFGTQYLFFKKNNKPWNTRKFREALLQAIPYEELRKDYYVPAETFVYPLSGYPNINGINDYDLDYAMDIMKEARKEAGIPSDEKITVTFAIFEADYLKKWAELLKQAWAPLGVNLEIQTTEIDRYNSSIPYWNADIFEYSWIGDFADPLAFLELFRGDSTLNVAGYKNDEYDRLLAEAATADTMDEHDTLLSKAEQVLLDDCFVIPVSHPVSLHYIDTGEIGGWQPNALDLHPLKYIYIKSKPVNIPNLVMAY